MKRALLLLPLLAACTAPADRGAPTSPLLDIFRDPRAAEPEPPAPLPPQVIAALPPGVPPTVVTRNPDGCYLITLERTNPPVGYPLRDAAGNPVCDGQPVVTAVAPLPAPGFPAAPAAAPAVVTAPLTPPAAGGASGGPPVPTAVLGAPPPPGEPVVPPLAPGDITPPAPIVQPNPA